MEAVGTPPRSRALLALLQGIDRPMEEVGIPPRSRGPGSGFRLAAGGPGWCDLWGQGCQCVLGAHSGTHSVGSTKTQPCQPAL